MEHQYTHISQEEFKSNVDRLMTRLKHMSEYTAQSGSMTDTSPITFVEESTHFREKVHLVGGEHVLHIQHVEHGLQLQLQAKIKELEEMHAKLVEYTNWRDSYAQLQHEKSSLEEQLHQAKLHIDFLSTQLKVGIPNFNSDEVLHLDKKLISGSMKHNELITKYLLMANECERLRQTDMQQRRDLHTMHNELMHAKARVQRLTQDLAHSHMIEEQNSDLKNQLQTLKTEYVVQKNDLEKAHAKIYNDGQYIANLERELEHARNFLKNRVDTIDNKHINSLRKTAFESNEILQSAMDSLKAQYEAQLAALTSQVEAMKKTIFSLEDQLSGLTTTLGLCHHDLEKQKQHIEALTFANAALDSKVHDRDEKIAALNRDHLHYRNRMDTQLHDTVEDARAKQLKQQDNKIAALIEQNKQLQNALHAQEIHHKTKLAAHQNELINDKNNEIQHMKTAHHNQHLHTVNQMQQAIDEQHQAHQRTKADAANQLNQLQAHLASHLATIDKVNAENVNLKAQVQQHKDANEKWRQHHTKSEKDKDHQQQQIQVLLQSLTELQAQSQADKAELAQKNQELKAAKTEQAKLKQALVAQEVTAQQQKQQLEKKSGETTLLNQQLQHMIDSYSKQEQQLKKPSDLEDKVKQLEATKQQQTKQIEKLQKDLQMWQVNATNQQPSNDSLIRQHEEALTKRFDKEIGVLVKQISEQNQLIERQKIQLQKK